MTFSLSPYSLSNNYYLCQSIREILPAERASLESHGMICQVYIVDLDSSIASSMKVPLGT